MDIPSIMSGQPRDSDDRTVRDPGAVADLQVWLGKFDQATRGRGKTYFERGQVASLWTDSDDTVSAEVEGSEIYTVTLNCRHNGWMADCTCPMEVHCKHVYAAALAWIQETAFPMLSGARRDEAKRVQTIPVAEKKPATAHGRPKKKTFREQWTPKIAEKLDRPLTDAEGRQLDQLAALFAEFSYRYGNISRRSVDQHGFGDLISPASDRHGALFAGWWDRERQPRDPWELWQYLAYDIERRGLAVPEVFRPMTDTTGIQALAEKRIVERELDTWREALDRERRYEEKPKSGPIASIVGLRGVVAADGSFSIETRTAPGKPWKPATQGFFNALIDAFPADFDHLPAADASLGVALAAARRSERYGYYGQQRVPPPVVAQLLRRPTEAAVFLFDGTPFAVEPKPLVIEAVISTNTPGWLQLTLRTPDGVDANAANVITERTHAGRRERLFLFDRRVWRGPPPLPTNSVPTAALADVEIMRKLRAAGVRLPSSLPVKVRHVMLRPRLRCWLSDDEPGTETEVRAQLVARADDPPCEQEWSGFGWDWSDGAAPPPRRADGPLLDFDYGAASEVSARLDDFRLAWLPREQVWSRPVTRLFPEEFAAWHATLPPGLDIELSKDLAALLAPPLRASVDFSAIPAGPGRDWFDIMVALKVEDTTLTADEIALLLKARGKWVRLPKHGWRRLELADNAGGEATAALARLGLGAADVLATGNPATHRVHALQLASEAAAFESRDAKLAAALRERAETLAAIPRPALPAGLTATLRPYQEEGFHFLAHLAANAFGGVLADDMGLGKTVQTLAWLLHLAAAGNGRRKPKPAAFRALVVCPKSVTHGWLAEAERFAPALGTVAFTPALASTAFAALNAPLVVANYAQLRLHAQWFQSAAWDAVVLDEGQFIKNPTSQAAVAARALATRHRLVLTGTPIENRLTDLWSLFAFAQPGLLGAQAAFRRQYPDDDAEAHARLRRRVSHFMLRRTKAQAAPDLPARTEDELVVALEGPQRKLYDAELKRARAQLLGIETDRALDKVRFHVLASLLRLRQICCHPALVDPAHRDLPSAKLEALLERLEELRDEGHQVLVFSQFVEMLELIRARLVAADIGHLLLTGATENRAALVDEFQRDPRKTVFLLSLKAAGFGLNLTAASYAILYDPWWNPAVEAQAIDRTHRIGQTRPVMAYRLLADDTVEQKIRVLQREKAALAAAVVQEESLAKVMDLESLRRILI